MSDRLKRLFDEHGQSPWLDNLKRSYITTGELNRVREFGIRGLTSNPTIFQKAIQGSDEYTEQFKSLIATKTSTLESYWELVLKDINGALDKFEPLYQSSGGLDGFVSVEVDPNLAHQGAETLDAGRKLHQRINRDNVMIKIPATVQGVPAIRSMISEGRNVNVTLIFSLDRYQDVMNAYIDGLEILQLEHPAKVAQVASVASFFISRVDTEIDRQLQANGSDGAIALCGTAAIAQAKLAYQMFEQTFSGARWEKLAALGAHVQRPLWASTSTKNVKYPDTLYVDQLIGPNTVNTLPDTTVEAFSDHGNLGTTINQGVDQAHWQWSQLAEYGVDVVSVAAQLENEGVSSFRKSFDELLSVLDAKAVELT